jgi:hypothetical protein
LRLAVEPPPATAPAAMVSLMGLLESRVAAGGETTGWVLRYGDKQRVDLLLPIDAFGWIHDGMAVAVKGHFEMRDYPERGRVRVLVVKEISQVVT